MKLISKVKVALMVLFVISDSFALDIELLFDVHQANGNKLQNLDGSGAQLDYNRAETPGLRLIDKREVARMGALCPSVPACAYLLSLRASQLDYANNSEENK